MNPPKPMLAATLDDPKQLNYSRSFLVSPKIDGVRAILWNGCFYSRSLKPLPNEYLQSIAEKLYRDDGINYLDGEITIGEPNRPAVYNETVSIVMAKHKPLSVEDFRYNVFDRLNDMNTWYGLRHESLMSITPVAPICFLQTEWVSEPNEVANFEEYCLSRGFEGIIIRAHQAPYKQGRSTLKEAGMLKLKRFADAEATIIGFEPLMRNWNPAFTNELGHTARSSHQANLVPDETLGALTVSIDGGPAFNIGTGFTADQRRLLWATRSSLIGKIVKFKHMPYGQKDLPRHPVFLGFRPEGA